MSRPHIVTYLGLKLQQMISFSQNLGIDMGRERCK